MSTLTSADLHIKRSSTRLHAPPGGVSSLSFGCGGLGTTEPAEESLYKNEPPASRSGRYTPMMTSFGSNDRSAPAGYSAYSSPYTDSAADHNYPQRSNQQQLHQYQTPYNANGQNSFSNRTHSANDNSFQTARPPSSTPSARSSARSSSSSSSWGSQPPLTSSKRDQNWEKKRRQWLMRKNSNNYGDCPPSTSWGNSPSGGMMNDGVNPLSPLSKFMHQHAQQQQPNLSAEHQRLGSANSSRSNNYMSHQPYEQESYPAQTQMPSYSASGAPLSRAGLSTASSTVSSATSGRRQPPGGQCQWSLG